MSFLQLEGRTVLVFGVANRKSVAWAAGQTLEAEGARVIYSVQSEKIRGDLQALLKRRQVHVCDVRREEEIEALAEEAGKRHAPLHGILHSVAFADYSGGFKAFHETSRGTFLEAAQVSAFSLVEISRAFKPHLANDASIVAMGISSQVTAPSYGCMSPVKAALESCARFLAKSFSADTEMRFNTVNAGPLKTSASAGIPGYLENYLFAEKLTFRKRSLDTQEAANAIAFLISPRSSGINGQGIVVNAGMDWNYFDEEVVRLAMRPEGKKGRGS